MNLGNTTTPVYFLEFNELCPGLLERFMSEGRLPNFARFYKSATIYTTDAEESAPQLEPWIQWLSVHSGVSYSEHKAFHLGDGRSYSKKCIAELLSDAGIRVGVFGSMNTNYRTLNGYYIPDPWAANVDAQPSWLSPFFDVVAGQVQESSKAGGLTKSEMVKFGWFMLRHGLTADTIKAIVAQLIAERSQPELKWRRASLLEKIQYDLFRYLDRSIRPQFATFFCNSTAHYQHYYWRNMHPEIFEFPPGEDDHPSLETAIRYGYEQMDDIVGRFLRDYPRATLMLCTALSQQPWTETTKCVFRPRDFNALLQFAEIPLGKASVEPVMAEEFRLSFSSEADAETSLEKLTSLTVGNEPVLKLERKGQTIFGGCSIQHARMMDEQVHGPADQRARFSSLFHMVHSVRSGRHHPDGVLWIRNGKHQVIKNKVPLTAIAPTILRRFGVPVPEFMVDKPLESLWEKAQLSTPS